MITNVEYSVDDITGLYELHITGDEEDIEKVEAYAIGVMDGENEGDMVNHPSHYTDSGMECIDEMIMLYGVEEVRSFCKLNAHKYRKRAMKKGGQQDVDKSDWYLKMYAKLSTKQDYMAREEIQRKYKEYLNN